MDTRWKNKIALIALILLFTFGTSGILTCIFNGGHYFKKDYFQTSRFEGQLEEFIGSLRRLELMDMTEEEAKEKVQVTEEEINEHRYRYGELSEQIANIKEQYEDKIKEALLENNKDIADIHIAERDKKIEDITNNFKSDEHIRQKIIKEKEKKIEDYYKAIERERPEFLKWKSIFIYHLKDIATGKIYTNWRGTENQINEQNMLFIRNYPVTGYGYITASIDHMQVHMAEVESLFQTIDAHNFQGKIAIPKKLPATNLIMVEYYKYQQEQKLFFIYMLSCIVAFILSIYIYRKKFISENIIWEKWQSHYKKIPIDLKLTAFIFMLLFTLSLFLRNGDLYIGRAGYQYLYDFIKELLIRWILTAISVALTFIHAKLLLDNIKAEQDWLEEWKRSLLYRFYLGLRESFLVKSIGIQVFILLSVAFGLGVGAVLVLIIAEFWALALYVLLFIVIGIPTFMIFLKRAGYLNKIVKGTEGLIKGNLDADLPIKGRSALAKLAEHINMLKHGVRVSQREQAKSERLKTELITNVSHDLRTPLTSIISYTELLKAPDLVDEDRTAYIEIIDRKSKRLKVLIDDLFDASKMASGSVELVKEKVDMVQLLQQALAEHDEAIRKSTLQFRVTNSDKAIFAIVDGQKIWRVFDNLIGNILKYSLENTRVYISTDIKDGNVIIEFKNIAKYELGGDIDEFFERFKRGDASRHTEGSGLGLAIAKSIVDIHGGNMDINIDGDLFKVTVSLHLLC